MATKQETYYVVYIDKYNSRYFLSHWNDWTGDYDLGDKPYRFSDKDYARSIASNKNFVLNNNDKEERFGLLKVTETLEEIPVSYPAKKQTKATETTEHEVEITVED